MAPGGMLIPRKMGQPYEVMSIDRFIAYAEKVWDENKLVPEGFYEIEASNKTERFGNVAHVFSTYLSFFKKGDATPFERGINSIQAYFDEGRWWCLTVLWDIESDGLPIPAKYLP